MPRVSNYFRIGNYATFLQLQLDEIPGLFLGNEAVAFVHQIRVVAIRVPGLTSFVRKDHQSPTRPSNSPTEALSPMVSSLRRARTLTPQLLKEFVKW